MKVFDGCTIYFSKWSAHIIFSYAGISHCEGIALTIKRSTKTGKKVWKQVKMVQIQCATDKKFEHIVKTINVAKKKTNYTIKGLKRKKTYYIRVRYAGGSAVYSKWSAIKKIKTR